MNQQPPFTGPPPILTPQKSNGTWKWLLGGMVVVGVFCGCCGTCLPGAADLIRHPGRLSPGPRTTNIATPLLSVTLMDATDIRASIDGSVVIALTANALTRLDPGTLKPESIWRSPGPLLAFDLARDGSRCAVLTQDGFAIVLDAHHFSIIGKIALGVPSNIYADSSAAIGISPKGDRVAGCQNGMILGEWSTSSYRRLWTQGPTASMSLSKICYSADGKWLLGARAGRGRWTALRSPTGKVETFATDLEAVFDEGSMYLGYKTGDFVKVRRLDANTQVSFKTDHRDWAIAVSEDGRAMTSAPGGGPWIGGRTEIWSAVGNKICDLDHEDAPLTATTWWNGYPVAGGHDGQLFIFDPNTGKQLIYLKGHHAMIQHVLVKKDRLFTIDEVGQICLWSWPKKLVS